MSSSERPTDPQSEPSQLSLKDSLGALEQELLEGNFDWSLIQPSSDLIQIRKDLMQWLHDDYPDWDETLIVQTAARVETVWKVARYEQLSQTYGESDERVVHLREDIEFWNALLNPNKPKKR